MAVNNLTQRSDEQQVQGREETRSVEKFLRPPVNIVETEEGLALIADIPGASREKLEISVDKGVLTINAPIAVQTQGTPRYAEFELASYYRQFSLPEVLDHEKTKAELVNGVLTLQIPKAEKAKPRRIEIQVS